MFTAIFTIVGVILITSLIVLGMPVGVAVVIGLPGGFLLAFWLISMLKSSSKPDNRRHDTSPANSNVDSPEPAPEISPDAMYERYKRAVILFEKCEDHGIELNEGPIDQSAVWIVAESLGIASREEALELLSEALNPSPETKAALKAHDSNEVDRHNELYPATLIGKDKYLTKIKEELRELEEKHKALLAFSDSLVTGSIYVPTKPKNVTLEAAKGQLIGGPGLAAAKAISAEKYNSSHPDGGPGSSAMQAAFDLGVSKRMEASKLEPRIKELRAQIADIEARLIDLDNQEKYTKFARCKINLDEVTLTDGGNVLVWIYSPDEKGATILGEPAIVDGSLIISAYLNGEQIGQSVFCPERGFDGDLRKAGFGDLGTNGGERGDLLVEVNVARHPIFQRQDMNIFSTAPITFAQAALGGEMRINTVDGEVSYEVKPGTQTDTRIRLKGKGVPSLRNKNVRGDHYVTLVVQTPTNLNEEAKKALEAFDAACGNRPSEDSTSETSEKTEKKKKGFREKVKEMFEE